MLSAVTGNSNGSVPDSASAAGDCATKVESNSR